MICPKCNKTIEDSALFCGFCGAPIESIGLKEIEEPIPLSNIDNGKSNEVKQVDQPKPKIPASKNNTRLWITISSVIAIIIIAFIVFEKFIAGYQIGHQQSDTTSVVHNKDQQVVVADSSPPVTDRTPSVGNIQPEKVAPNSSEYRQSANSVQSEAIQNTQKTSPAENSEIVSGKESSGSSTGKDDSGKNQELTEEKIYTFIHDMPSFPGGNEALVRYIQNNLRYPQIAKESGIQGIVYTSFVVETDGRLTAVRILNGIGSGCDEEALRLIKAMPTWFPGKQANKIVRVQYNLPIKFSL